METFQKFIRPALVNMYAALAICLVMVSHQASAQSNAVYQNYNASPDRLKSVLMHVDGLPLSLPVANLNSSTSLLFSFDELKEDVKDYSYSIIHCDKDWYPTQLDRMDYLSGFDQEIIKDYSFSISTRIPYVHYELLIPNNDVSLKLSGNYALLIYDDEFNSEEPVIIRRFMITESQVEIIPEVTYPLGVGKLNTHQEIDFIVVPDKNLIIQRPRQELYATIVKNYSYHDAITNILPSVERASRIEFNLHGKIVFPAGKEFRSLDLRSVETSLGTIRAIDKKYGEIIAYNFPEASRSNQSFDSHADADGQFLILNQDFNSPELSGEYVSAVFFFLSENLQTNYDIYVFGSFNDYQLEEENKMSYNVSYNAYTTSIVLKQGFYDYNYIAVPKSDTHKDIDLDLEGNWYETNNVYTILLYQTPFGARYDKLIGVYSFNSND